MRPPVTSGLLAALVVVATAAMADPAASAPEEDDSSLGWEPWTTLDARRGLDDFTAGVVTDDGRIVLQWSNQRQDRLYTVVRGADDVTWPAFEALDGQSWLSHRLVTDGDNQVVSISTDPYHSSTIGFHRLGSSGWGPYESVPAESITFGGGVNAAGDVLVMWPEGYTLQGAVYSNGEWTHLPSLEFEPVNRSFLHYRLLDNGGVVVMSISPPGDYSHDINVIEVNTLTDGVWASEEFLPGDAAELSWARAATSPAGDVVVWWGRQNTEGAELGDLVVAVRHAGAPNFAEPTAISGRHQCIGRRHSPCAEAAVLDSGKVVMTYRTITVDELEMVSNARWYDLASGRWSKPQRLVPGRFARPECGPGLPCDSFDVDLRPDRRAVVHTSDRDRTYDCPTVASCHRVDGLSDLDRAQLLARPGSGAVAFRTAFRCGEEECHELDFRATVLD